MATSTKCHLAPRRFWNSVSAALPLFRTDVALQCLHLYLARISKIGPTKSASINKLLVSATRSPVMLAVGAVVVVVIMRIFYRRE